MGGKGGVYSRTIELRGIKSIMINCIPDLREMLFMYPFPMEEGREI
jgi:hypothetical protein